MQDTTSNAAIAKVCPFVVTVGRMMLMQLCEAGSIIDDSF